MKKCSICDNKALFKIKNEEIYYCQTHAREFFEENALENIQQISKSVKQANALKEYLDKIK
ncbi:MAG: hypothetical protein ACOC16_01750 [Nanoarchaeota archaeon]